MVSLRILTLCVLFSAVLCAENYSPVLRAIDDMIAREEQRQHLLEHTKNLPHSGDLRRLPHDYAYTDDYAVKDLVDGVAYVDALQGAPPPTLPIFTDKDKSDFTRVEMPSASLSDQQKLHQQLTNQQGLLDNNRKDVQLKQKTLQELLKEEEKLKNPLNGLPQFTTDEHGNKVAFVQVCTPDMPNGIPCPGGRCQSGKCKQDQGCYDDCCVKSVNGTIAAVHGTPCKGGFCLEGRCRAFPVCVGECCTGAANDVAKPNGTPCAQGHCHEGGCTSDVGCNSGECCNAFQKRIFPKGFPCHVNSCQEKSFCTGTSVFCPETEPKPDESICTAGMCRHGVCEKTGVVAKNATEKICTAGPCCDVEKGAYLPKGASCSSNPCATGGACTGSSADCTISPKPVADGTPCPNGKCKEGICIAIAMCEAGDECCVNGVLLPDYHVCNGGRCFRGKCVHDVPCLGVCCKPHNGTGVIEPVSNGTPCSTNNGTDVCQNGQCVSPPLCVGTCCEATGVAADGKPCNTGVGRCVGGRCVDETKKCTNGTCCDETAGLMRPQGYPCRASACSEEMSCTGKSTFCPVSPLHRTDGTPCPGNGKCHGGLCVVPPKHVPDCNEGVCCDTQTLKFKPAGLACGTDPCKETTYCTGSSASCPVTLDVLPDGTVCKLTDKAVTDWKCEAGICKEPPPTFHMENVDIDLTRPTCNVTSGCCNNAIGRVRPLGYICSVAQTPCMKDVVCDGETPKCSPHVLEDGAACPGGACVHGFCVKGIDPTDTDAVHEIHIHVVPKEHKELTPSEALNSQLLEDDEDEESSGSLEELMTIITREVDGKVTERAMRIPLNALEKAKTKSLGLAGESTEKAEKKLAERTAQIEAAARARIEAMKAANATATNSTANANVTESSGAPAEHKNATAPTPNEHKPDNHNHAHAHQRKQPQSAVDAFTSAYPMPRTGVIDPLTGVVRLTNGPGGCSKGACCDVKAGVFYTRGFQCATPKNLCKMAACTGYSDSCHVMDRPDGAVCPGGHCFEGTCVKACVGECCDHHRLPRPNGVGCATDSFCYEGVCVHNCTGECCNEFNFARPDGALCTLGYCYEGKCFQTRDNMQEEAREAAALEGHNPDDADFNVAIPLYRREPPRNMEEEWAKKMKQVATEKEAEEALKDAEAKRQKELKTADTTTLNTIAQQVNLQAANDAKAEKGMTFALIGAGGFVGLLVIVAIIVAIVASKKKKTEKKDFDEYYDKF